MHYNSTCKSDWPNLINVQLSLFRGTGEKKLGREQTTRFGGNIIWCLLEFDLGHTGTDFTQHKKQRHRLKIRSILQVLHDCLRHFETLQDVSVRDVPSIIAIHERREGLYYCGSLRQVVRLHLCTGLEHYTQPSGKTAQKNLQLMVQQVVNALNILEAQLISEEKPWLSHWAPWGVSWLKVLLVGAPCQLLVGSWFDWAVL